MPWDALPPHINEPHEWDGYDDDDHWYTKWRKAVKGWFAFGPRSKHWWAKWRETPVTLLAVRGEGVWRYEDDHHSWGVKLGRLLRLRSGDFSWPWGSYLSRVQTWTKWHIQIQWPLFFAAHVTIRGQVWYAYIGAKRDADRVYWFPAIYAGKGFK